jgi:hypothetical protein
MIVVAVVLRKNRKSREGCDSKLPSVELELYANYQVLCFDGVRQVGLISLFDHPPEMKIIGQISFHVV